MRKSLVLLPLALMAGSVWMAADRLGSRSFWT